MPQSHCTHRVEVGKEAEGRGSIESEGQEVFEVELRLQRPSRDREGSQKGAALGWRTWTTHRDRCWKLRNDRETLTWATFLYQEWNCASGFLKVTRCAQRRPDFDLFDTGGTVTPPFDTQHTLHDSNVRVRACLWAGVCLLSGARCVRICVFCVFMWTKEAGVHVCLGGGKGSCVGDLILPSPQLPELIPQGHTPTAMYIHTHTHTHTNTSFNYWFIGWGKVPARREDGRYRISNGPGMKRFLIFRLAAFQWTGALTGAQALIPAPGSIIGVSCRSPRPPQSTPIMRAPVPHTHTYTVRPVDLRVCDKEHHRQENKEKSRNWPWNIPAA